MEKIKIKAGSNPIKIKTPTGYIDGVLESPSSDIEAFAIFAHCFTCGKDFLPEKRISKNLAARGVATLRIDFSGVGYSCGEFKDTSFLSNVEDLLIASEWLTENFQKTDLLVGHSLGGAAVLVAAAKIPDIKGVVTIGAPAEPSHVTHFFEDYKDEIMEKGQAEVELAGRKFTIGKKFFTDLESHNHMDVLANLKAHKLIMHSPSDETVELENAGIIYSALQHPKSFISLPNTDHLITKSTDANYIADVISVWLSKALE